MIEQKLLGEESGMAFALLVSKLEFERTINSYMLDTPQGLWEGKIMVVA